MMDSLEKSILFVMDFYKQSREIVFTYYWDEVLAYKQLIDKGVIE